MAAPYVTSSEEEFGLTVFSRRNSDLGVHLSSSATSSFCGQLTDAVQLLKEGFNVYPVEEHIHTDISLKLVSNQPIRTEQEILSGSFRDSHTKKFRFASTYSFLAQPKSWSAPTAEFLKDFSNWINGYSFTYELLCATPDGFTENGETKFSIEIFDDCSGYCSSDNAERAGLDALEAAVSKREIVMI